MKNITRKKFLESCVRAFGASVLATGTLNDLYPSSAPARVRMSPGFQVWTIRDKLVSDFPGTLKMMAGLGYRSVEMCSPPGYESSGFGPLMKLEAGEMKKICEDAGLLLESSHYNMNELRNHLDERIEFAAESGQKQMMLASFGLPRNATLDDWMKAADELNEAGVKVKAAGLILGFHNHNMEFSMLEGKLIYDALLERLDPEYVSMQFQVAVIELGYKASDYFRKHPGRFISAHLADWSPDQKKMVPLGQGVVDWKDFFISAKEGGVKNIFVEMDPSTFEESVKYLNNLRW